MSRSEIEIAVECLRSDLLEKLCADEKYFGYHPFNDKYIKGAEYCGRYLQKLISLENFCIKMIKECGFHERVKHLPIYNLLSKKFFEKYIGYDDVD